MRTLFKSKLSALLSIMLLAGLLSCKKDKEASPGAPSDYAIWLQLGSWPNTAQYVVGVSDLTKGSVSLKGNGAEVTSKADYGILPHNGYYYYPSTSANFGKFTKFEFTGNQLSVVKEVPFTYQSSVGNSAWIDDNTLILVGENGDRNKLLYSIVDANTLSIKNGEFSLPPVPDGYKYYVGGNLEFSNGKLYMAYSYGVDWPGTSEPGVNVAVINYPDMTVNNVIESTDANGEGGANMWMPTSGKDESGNIYMMFFPKWSTSTTSPSKIFKISNGATTFDASYTFDVGAALGEATEGFWYIGKNKAIVKYLDSKISSVDSETEHYRKFALVDLGSKSIIKKLDIPADKGSMLQNVMVDEEKVYVVANDLNGKDYVWNVNTSTGEATAGLEIEGGADYILRLDNLKK